MNIINKSKIFINILYYYSYEIINKYHEIFFFILDSFYIYFYNIKQIWIIFIFIIY